MLSIEIEKLKSKILEQQKLTEEASKQLQRELEKTKQRNVELEKDKASLQQELYKMQGTGSNLNGTFFTADQVRQNLKEFSEQRILEFITTFEDIDCKSLIEFIHRMKDFAARIVKKEYLELTNRIPFAESSNEFQTHLTSHLTSFYAQIMEKWEVPQINFPEGWSVTDELSVQSAKLLRRMHDIFWQITLSPKLKFAEPSEYDKAVHTWIKTEYRQPVVVMFEPLMFGTERYLEGYAY